MQIRFALKIKYQVQQFPVNIIDGFLEKIFLQHACGPRKLPQSAGAFGAAQIAAGGGFKADADGVAPLQGLAGKLGGLVAGPYFGGIPQAPWG